MAATARVYHQEMIHFLRRNITYSDATAVLSLGKIPAGSVIIKPISGVHVSTAFNAGTNNRLDIGTSDTADLYGTDLSLTSVGLVPCDEAVSFYVSSDTEVFCTVDVTGTAATTGAAQVVIAYIPNL